MPYHTLSRENLKMLIKELSKNKSLESTRVAYEVKFNSSFDPHDTVKQFIDKHI